MENLETLLKGSGNSVEQGLGEVGVSADDSSGDDGTSPIKDRHKELKKGAEKGRGKKNKRRHKDKAKTLFQQNYSGVSKDDKKSRRA